MGHFAKILTFTLSSVCSVWLTGSGEAQTDPGGTSNPEEVADEGIWEDQPDIVALLAEIVGTNPPAESRLCQTSYGPLLPDQTLKLLENTTLRVLHVEQIYTIHPTRSDLLKDSFCVGNKKACAYAKKDWWLYYCASGEGLFMGTAGRDSLPYLIEGVKLNP